jgi:hypothetical protein
MPYGWPLHELRPTLRPVGFVEFWLGSIWEGFAALASVVYDRLC